ncbi:MAG: cation:proton antiporter, partial [Spirochaetes bacterium]|nr:cation:proton antiporter [Spirochaetota bacterium]
MSLLTQLLVLIIAARLLGSLFKRFHQPAIVGEMLAGVILGPSVLNF